MLFLPTLMIMLALMGYSYYRLAPLFKIKRDKKYRAVFPTKNFSPKVVFFYIGIMGGLNLFTDGFINPLVDLLIIIVTITLVQKIMKNNIFIHPKDKLLLISSKYLIPIKDITSMDVDSTKLNKYIFTIRVKNNDKYSFKILDKEEISIAYNKINKYIKKA
ncbi:MAG: hypothetical protein ACRDAU_02960 [Clostridium sp.]